MCTFTVPAGAQQLVFDADQYSWPLYSGSKLTEVAETSRPTVPNGATVAHHLADD